MSTTDNKSRLDRHTDRFVHAWARVVVGHRWLVIAASVLLLGFLAQGLQHLSFKNSTEMWFRAGDPILENYAALKQYFGDTQYLLVGVEARPKDPNVITPDALEGIRKITRFLEQHEFVKEVNSLSNYQYIVSDEDTLTTKYLVEDWDALRSSPALMEDYARTMAGEKLVHHVLITPDLRHTAIMAQTVYKADAVDHHVQLINDLNTFLKQMDLESQGFTVHMFGRALISHQLVTLNMSDQGQLGMLLYVLVIVVLSFLFRTFSGVALTFGAMLLTIVATFGVMGQAGWSLTMINAQLPMVLTIVGIAEAIHVVLAFYQQKRRGLDSKPAAIAAVREVWVPCFWTAVTTFVGFISLATTDLTPLREYGFVAAIGVAIAFVICLTTLPAALSFLKVSPARTERIVNGSGLPQWIAKVGLASFGRRRLVLLAGGIILGTAIAFTARLSTDVNFVDSFKESSRIRQDFKYFDEHYKGGQPFEFIVDAGSEGGAKEPAFLARVLELQERIERMEGAGTPISVVNYIRKMNQAMNGDDPAFYRIPATRELVAQYLLLYENSGPQEDLSDLKSIEERYLRISVPIRNMTSGETTALAAAIRADIERNFQDLDVRLAGDLVLFNQIDDYIAKGFISSLGTGVFLIALCFFACFRSWRFTLIALVPNCAPMLIAGGILYLMGGRLDAMSLIVASITFGICVDDTIHVVSGYLTRRRAGMAPRESLHDVFSEVGSAICFTSIVLFCGFSVLTLSSLVPNVNLGLFSAIIIAAALLCELLLLPALIALVEKYEQPSRAPTVTPALADHPLSTTEAMSPP
jgi:uncharacterized protein